MRALPVRAWESEPVTVNAVCAVSRLFTFSLSPVWPALHPAIQFDLT